MAKTMISLRKVQCKGVELWVVDRGHGPEDSVDTVGRVVVRCSEK